jgi:hypothetical protein
MKKRNANPQATIFEKQVQYILTTANTWSGPIGRFHLIVDTDSPDLLLTCMPDLTRTSASRYEVTKTNFRPDRELDIRSKRAFPSEPESASHRQSRGSPQNSPSVEGRRTGSLSSSPPSNTGSVNATVASISRPLELRKT